MEGKVKEYESMFGTEGAPEAAVKALKERALRGELKDTPLRSVVWKAFLEVLPPYVALSEWPSRMKKAREEYEELIAKSYVDPHKESTEDSSFDPLSQSEDSPWNQFFQNEELQKDIYRDLERTYPEHEFFQTEETQKSLCRALFVYAKEHPEVGYRQGMHELLAPIYYVVHTEAKEFKDILDKETNKELLEKPSAVALMTIMDEKYIEHDSFALFAALMNNAEEFFLTSKTPIAPTATAEASTVEKLTPVVTRCRKVQDELLRAKDPALHKHLVECNIEPQIYCMRWLRLLFGREFHLEDLIILWDAIFAYGRSLSFADYIAVVMLIYIREQLLSMDELSCMKRLLKYPPVEDVSIFIKKAMELIKPSKNTVGLEDMPGAQRKPTDAPSGLSSSSGSVSSSQTRSSGGMNKQHDAGKKKKGDHHGFHFLDVFAQAIAQNSTKDANGQPPERRSAPSSSSSSSTSQSSSSIRDGVPKSSGGVVSEENAELKKAKAEIARLNQDREYVAARLDRVVFLMQEALRKNEELMNNDDLVSALAEIKQIFAICSNGIDASPL